MFFWAGRISPAAILLIYLFTLDLGDLIGLILPTREISYHIVDLSGWFGTFPTAQNFPSPKKASFRPGLFAVLLLTREGKLVVSLLQNIYHFRFLYEMPMTGGTTYSIQPMSATHFLSHG